MRRNAPRDSWWKVFFCIKHPAVVSHVRHALKAFINATYQGESSQGEEQSRVGHGGGGRGGERKALKHVYTQHTREQLCHTTHTGTALSHVSSPSGSHCTWWRRWRQGHAFCSSWERFKKHASFLSCYTLSLSIRLHRCLVCAQRKRIKDQDMPELTRAIDSVQ